MLHSPSADPVGTTGTHNHPGAKLESAVHTAGVRAEAALHGASHPGATTGTGVHTGTHTHHTVQSEWQGLLPASAAAGWCGAAGGIQTVCGCRWSRAGGPLKRCCRYLADPATGEVHDHTSKLGASLDKAWQDTKSAVPGTKEHKATHASSTATGPGTFQKF